MHRNLCAIWKRQRIQDLQGHTIRGRFSLSRSLDRAGHSSVISVHNSGTMVSVTKTTVSMTENMFSLTKTAVSAMKKIFSFAKTMVSLTVTVVSVTHTIFSEAEKMVSVPQTTVGAIERTGSTPARDPIREECSLFNLDQNVADVKKFYAGPVVVGFDLQCISIR